MLNVELDSDDKMQYGDGYFSSYLNTALYNPIQYLPLICASNLSHPLNCGIDVTC